MRDRQAHERPMHRLALLGPPHCRLGAEPLDRLAHGEGVRRRRQRLAEIDEQAIRNALRPFPEELAALIAENAAPDRVEADRNDRHRTAFDDLLVTALE